MTRKRRKKKNRYNNTRLESWFDVGGVVTQSEKKGLINEITKFEGYEVSVIPSMKDTKNYAKLRNMMKKLKKSGNINKYLYLRDNRYFVKQIDLRTFEEKALDEKTAYLLEKHFKSQDTKSEKRNTS